MQPMCCKVLRAQCVALYFVQCQTGSVPPKCDLNHLALPQIYLKGKKLSLTKVLYSEKFSEKIQVKKQDRHIFKVTQKREIKKVLAVTS